MIKQILIHIIMFSIFMALREYAGFEPTVISAISLVIAILIKNDAEKE